MLEKTLQFLSEKGSKELKSNSAKYRKFSHPSLNNTYYWLGKNGALRIGRTSGESISISDLVKRATKGK